MSKYSAEQLEGEAARLVATLMAATARTAPKSKGLDSIQTLVVDGEELNQLAGVLAQQGKEERAYPKSWTNSAALVKKSKCVLLIGVRGAAWETKPLNCGACGYKDCTVMQKTNRRQGQDFTGPTCLFKAIDLGIAIGAAVKLASDLNADNRIFYTIGSAAKRLNLLDSDVVMGIPISISGKNPYFDLGWQATMAGSEELPLAK